LAAVIALMKSRLVQPAFSYSTSTGGDLIATFYRLLKVFVSTFLPAATLQ
jgi:hypothetical protein